MKRIIKYASGLILAGAMIVLMSPAANAQRGGFHGGGGGGFHGSAGGGGFHGSSAVRASSGFGVRQGTREAMANRPNTFAYGQRSAFGYRSGLGYYAGYGYHGGAFYRPGFGYYGYPHLGFYINVLPFGYYPFYWNSALYYYYGGIFYAPYDNGGYQVTEPPVGAAVPSLPDDATSIKIDGIQYYEADGVYYKQTTDDKGKRIYVVAGRNGVLNTGDNVTDPNADAAYPKVGDIVNQLPDDCRKIELNGKKYFVSPDGIYYERVTDPDGNTAYRIASLPDDQNQGQDTPTNQDEQVTPNGQNPNSNSI